MKKLILITIACLSIFSACKKDDDPSNKDLLCGKNWKLTSISMSNGVNTYDVYADMEDCDKDDVTQFKTDGTMIQDTRTKCDVNELATTTGKWVFNSTETIITIDNEENWEIVELTSSTLKVKFQSEYEGTKYTTNATLITVK